METDPDTADKSVAQEATAIAGGSAIVMAGGIVERAVRMLTTWFLSGALGTAGFGLYAFATTVASIVGAIAPLGMDAGMIMYGARYRASNERGRLKGALLTGLGTVAVSGPVFAIAVWVLVRTELILADRPEEGAALVTISAGIVFVAVFSVLLGALVSAKDMVSQTLSQLIALPCVLLIGAMLAVWTGLGIDGVIMAFILAHAVASLMAARRFWARDGSLLRDAAIRPLWERAELFRYALPQSFARVLYRANLWVDILMLTALATLADVGVYRVSVALAMMGALPVVASTTMFGPVIAELVYTDQQQKLNALLKIVTRWLLVVATPLYFGVLLLPDVVLAVFDEAYLGGVGALLILMGGQAIYVMAAPTGAILTNAGHSTLNLVNGLIAVSLNVALNAWLIPIHGLIGAAIASATALGAWSLLRVVAVYWLHRCHAFSWRAAIFVGAMTALGVAVQEPLETLNWMIRIVTVAGLAVAGLAMFWAFARTDADEAVIERVRTRLGR